MWGITKGNRVKINTQKLNKTSAEQDILKYKNTIDFFLFGYKSVAYGFG